MRASRTHLVNADFCTLLTALSISTIRPKSIQELTQVLGQIFRIMLPNVTLAICRLRRYLLDKPLIFFLDPFDERLGEIAIHKEGRELSTDQEQVARAFSEALSLFSVYVNPLFLRKFQL